MRILSVIIYLIPVFQCVPVQCIIVDGKIFTQDIALKGYTCQEDKVRFKYVIRKISCAIKCLEDTACLSISYDPDRRQCTGCASRSGVHDAAQDTAQFYKLEMKSEYIGCFKDCPRILSTELISSSSMTTELCLDHCKSMANVFAMTEYGIQCFCGNSDDFTELDVQVPDSDCNYSCPGNSSQKCGGFCRGSMYHTGL